MKEQTIIDKIKAYLKTIPNLFFWKEHGGQYGSISHYSQLQWNGVSGGSAFQPGTAGIPDIIVCYKGKFITFECKLPGRKPTLLQAITLRKIMLAGGIAVVVTSLDQAKEIIESIK